MQNFKKTICLMLAVVCLVSLAACGHTPDETPDGTTVPTSPTQTPTQPSTTPTPPAHIHSFGDWQTDSKNHWKVCACNEKSELGAHTDTDANEKCDSCSSAMPIEKAPTATAEQLNNITAVKTSSAGGTITAHPGGRITYKIAITNNNSKAVSLNVTDTIPANTVFVSGCENVSGSSLSWEIKTIEPGKTVTLTYKVSPNYTVKQVRESNTDIILKNTSAKVMDKVIAAPTKNIWVLPTFNTTDQRRMQVGIDALITANVAAKNSADQVYSSSTLIAQMYGVGFTRGVSVNKPGIGLDRVFKIYGSTTATADDLATAQQHVNMMVPTLYGGTQIPASKDSLFRGSRATTVSISDLITGDVIQVTQNGVDKMYIVRVDTLVEVGTDKVVAGIDPATVLPGLPSSDRYAVLRPSVNLVTSFSVNDDEFYNDADKSEYTELEKALIATAEAYWLRGDRTQYDTSMMSQKEFRKEPLTKYPEDYTIDQYGYLDCSTFTYDLHWATYGYAAKATGSNGKSKNYNLCANILDCMSVGWNAETKTGSNKSALLYYKTKTSYTDAEKQTIHDEIASVLRPGDLIVYEYADGSGGHIMAYVGKGLLIHCTGGSFPKGGTHDSHEASIRCMSVDELFDANIYSHGHLFTKTTRFGVCRPQNLTTPKITSNAVNRVVNMQGIVGEKVSSAAMGKTVNPGDTITYTFYVYNANAEAKGITINDVLGKYVTFVSATDGGSCSGSNVSWKLTVPAGTRISVSYTVRVNSGVATYAAIDGSKATINGVAHKCYNTYVANTLTADQQKALVNAVNTVKGMDRAGLNVTAVAELIYKTAFGVDDLFGDKVDSLSKLIGNITDDNSRENIGVFNDTNYWDDAIVSLMDSNPSKPAKMVAPGMYGGKKVYSSKLTGETYTRYLTMGGTTLRSRYFWEKDLVIGDLYFLNGSSASYVYIYVGNGTLVNLTNMQEYPVQEWIQRAPDTSKWHYYAVLRPSIANEAI